MDDVDGAGGAVISCVMPTLRRRQWVLKAIENWQRQTWFEQDRELVIVEDVEPSLVRDLMPFLGGRIRYYFTGDRRLVFGEKRNAANLYCRGEYIAHWDDDDWYHPERLADQMAALGPGVQVVGYRSAQFHDVLTGEVREYRGGAGDALDSSLLYRRAWWQRHPFPNAQLGADLHFITEARPHLVTLPGLGRMVARNHGSNSDARLGWNSWPPSLAPMPEGYAA